MYPVSEAYKDAVYRDTREYRTTGQIKLTDGRTYPFTDDDISRNSLCISRQCVNGSEITLGAVYAAQMQVTLFSKIDRYALFDAEISLSFSLKLPDGTSEDIPMGIYYVSEPVRNFTALEVVAYDGMLRFDKAFSDATSGTAYDILMFLCGHCGMELGMTAEEVRAFPNGGETLAVAPDNDIESCRDLLFYLGQALCCFSYIGRDGKLYLKGFGADAVDVIPHKHRRKTKFADYVTRYTAVRYENVKKGTLEYHSIEPDDGLTMDLGQNPLLQGEKGKLADALVQKLSRFSYVPFEGTFSGNPALDPGDVIRFEGGHADESKISCITHYDFKYHGSSSIKCVGKNPRLVGVQSKTDKQLARLKNSVSENILTLYRYTNTKKYAISQSRVEVVSIQYVTTKSTNAEFKGVVLLDVAKAGTLSVVYVSSDNEISDFVPMQVLTTGKHIINLYYPLAELMENVVGTFRVLLVMDAGSATIERGGIKATVVGQGFAAAGNEWDGRIEINEEIRKLHFQAGSFSVKKFASSVGITYPSIAGKGFSETIGRIQFGGGTFRVNPLTENLTERFVIKFFTMDAARPGTYDDTYVEVSDNAFTLRTAYSFESVERPIDQGRMCEAVINTDQFAEVMGIEVV